MKRKDFRPLWELYTPEIFEHMLKKVETFEQLASWRESGLGKQNIFSFVVENMETDQVVGTTRIYAIDEKNKSCEIGSTFYAKSVQRTHVNTTVKLALLTYCFEELSMIRVQFKTDAENLRSQKALERIGAVREGVLRNERIRSTGKPRDAVVYSIIDREWAVVKKELTEKLHKYA
jgi:RimJ/RimL family protein N-acetyltransferase